jgi:DNA gyrase subunit B
MNQLVENGHIYIAQPPLFKVRQNKKEQYLKDEQELEQYLIESALEGAELKLDSSTLSGDALGSVAKDMILNEAIIRRLANRYEPSILRAIFLAGEINLDSLESTQQYADKLKELTSVENINFDVKANPNSEKYLIEINQLRHGNLITSILDEEFLLSGEYKQIIKTALVTKDLIKDKATIMRGDKSKDVGNFKEVVEWLMEEAKTGLNIQRYKGLGEMNPSQLWETTMDPSVRRLLQVKIEDAISADQVFSTLMGDQVEPRRNFIEANALGVNNLDI